ncbi:hypothetical protein DPMN_192702 [Dreissena polymorpha]|uniref:Uncharacterized protein n=1 Tax=Dreissena polymorpha TaxID=45954 RepID=A0A9D3Y3Q6_DREPO|nr:hypothetical protein DPMN_192702 [Dreissena polymorpha]
MFLTVFSNSDHASRVTASPLPTTTSTRSSAAGEKTSDTLLTVSRDRFEPRNDETEDPDPSLWSRPRSLFGTPNVSRMCARLVAETTSISILSLILYH